MAKNVVFNEGQDIKVVKKVAKLRTVTPESEIVTWVPEDETRLVPKTIIEDGTYIAAKEAGKPYGYSEVTVSGVGSQVIGQTAVKTITKNGTYIASEDKDGPFYGYSKVIVNVENGKDSQSGKTTPVVGTDTDGDVAMVVPDPETKELTIKKLPVSIEVTTPPIFTGPYGSGAYIGLDGIVVTAYGPDGEVWDNPDYPGGIIPQDELVLPEPVARYDPDSDTSGGHSSALDTSPVEQPIPEGVSTIYGYRDASKVRYTIEAFGGAVFITGAPNESNFWVLVASKISGGGVRITDHRTGGVETLNADNSFGSTIGNGYLGITNVSAYPENIDFTREGLIRTSEPVTNRVNIAATILHGDVVKPGSQQSVPVQWPRPGDGEVLETSFYIAVVDVSPREN